MPTHYVGGQGALWIQVDGPNTEPQYLGCHALGDVDIPKGPITLIECPDPAGPSRHRVVGSVRGSAGAITSSVTTSITDTFDYFERLNCPFTLFVNMVKSGRMDVFGNADRQFIFVGANVTNEGLTSLTARTSDDNTRSDQSFDFSAETFLRLMEQEIARQTISETQAINDISFCNEAQCRTDEDIAQEACEVGFAAANAGVGVTANVLVTSDGASWAAAAVDPFAADEHVIAVECFELGRNETRGIVARGSTDAGNPAEISYTDNSGAAWTAVNIGSVNGQFVEYGDGLFALDRNLLFAGMDDGYLYKSTDAGLTWSLIDAGVITANGIRCIRFVDQNVGWFCGDSNVIARSIDGGDSWSTITGPSAEAGNDAHVIEVLDRNRAWVGYSSGTLYYTTDAGVTWSERGFSGSGTGEVQDIKFVNDTQAYLLHDNASPVATVLWSSDGGYSWTSLTTATNSGGTSLSVCDSWNFYISGLVNGGTGFIAKGTI